MNSKHQNALFQKKTDRTYDAELHWKLLDENQQHKESLYQHKSHQDWYPCGMANQIGQLQKQGEAQAYSQQYQTTEEIQA